MCINQNTVASSYFKELCICIGKTISRKYTSKENTNQKNTPICKKIHYNISIKLHTLRVKVKNSQGMTKEESCQTRTSGGLPVWLTWGLWLGICNANAMLLASKLSSKAIRAPWTPDSIKLFAYSRSPIDWTHLISLSLDQTSTSEKQSKPYLVIHIYIYINSQENTQILRVFQLSSATLLTLIPQVNFLTAFLCAINWTHLYI